MPPVVILVRPQMGENIGAAARAMLNFGLSELRLVAPRDGWPNPKAHDMAAHAQSIVEQAAVFDMLGDAVADCRLVIATSARLRHLPTPAMEPDETVAWMVSEHRNTKTAWVFGPERSGLTNEEMAGCSRLVTIPTHPKGASLNIAQSVVILGYEWWKKARDEPSFQDAFDGHFPRGKPKGEALATAGELERLQEHLVRALSETHFFDVAERKDRMLLNMRAMAAKAGFTGREVKTLHGIIRALKTG